MKSIRVGIVAKGLIVVAIPLVFSCILVAALSNLQGETERAAARAQQARRISSLVNNLIHDLYIGMASITLKAESFCAGESRRERIERAKAEITELKSLLAAEDVSALVVLEGIEQRLDQGNALIARAEKAYQEGNTAELMDLRRRTQSLAGQLISADLIALGEKERAISASDAAIQADLREQMRRSLWLALALSIVGTLGLAFVITRSVTRRLANLNENSARLAVGKTLSGPLVGGDEIAELDGNFHKMAIEIEKLLQRERIILENARDIICVTDNNLQILSISPSVEEVLGLRQSRLLGSSCLKLLDQSRNPEAAEIVSQALSAREAADDFEVVLSRDGQLINFLVSLSLVSDEEGLILIFHDITSIKETERFKQQVVSMVSHDMRSPLTTVSHILEMLEAGMYGQMNDQGMVLLQQAEQSTADMSALIADWLDLDKIENGKLILNPKAVSSRTLLERAIMLNEERAAKFQCQLTIEQCQGTVWADAGRVTQVLSILIGKALQKATASSRISLSANLFESFVEFSVVGQSAIVSKNIASPSLSAVAASPGGGLDLAVGRALVEVQGGSLLAVDEEQGNYFCKFRLPAVAER